MGLPLLNNLMISSQPPVTICSKVKSRRRDAVAARI